MEEDSFSKSNQKANEIVNLLKGLEINTAFDSLKKAKI